jgi:nicotinamide-nucleotide amidase
MKAEIISVGTELLLGEITDTNAPFLASELPRLGIDLYFISQIGDNQARLVEALKRAWQRSDLILITGGLGPTEDDLTRESIAEMLGEELQSVPAIKRQLQEFFSRLGREMSATNLKQATIIPSGKVIPNPNGTAPGWWVEKDSHLLVAMPGPPGEMQPMWRHEILPRLQEKPTGRLIFPKILKTFGLSEATVGELVSHLVSSANPTLGIYAKADGIHLRLAAKAENQKQAETMIAEVETKLRSILGKYIWGTDSDTLPSVVGDMLAEKGVSLAVMEGYTGGLLTAILTETPSVAKHFRGGLVACSDKVHIACGIDPKLISEHGAGSAEVAEAMAKVAGSRLGAAIGVGLTGVDEPNEKGARPVSLIYIGLDNGKNSRVTTTRYPGNKARVKHWAVTAALFQLRKMLAAG